MRQYIILLFIGIFIFCTTAPAHAQDCTGPDGDVGVLKFNLDYGVLQICTAKGWIGVHSMTCPDGDRCAGTADAFSFTDVTGAATSAQIESNIIQVSGLTWTGGVSITGDGSPEFRICSAVDCSTEITPWGSAEAEINSGDYLQLRLTSSASGTTLHSASVTINGTSDQWDVTTGAPTPTNCDTIGQQCDDDSFYIGISPADGERVYMTSAAHEGSSIRWDSASCYRCGDGTIATSQTDGRANTNALLAFNATGFDAAAYCDGLEAHGYDDWYLPAGGSGTGTEQNLFWAMVQAEGTVDGIGSSGSWYWSSSEDDSGGARVQRFSDGRQPSDGKYGAGLVRCVRR